MSVISFENHCVKIRSYLDSYMNDELLVETNHEVLKHLDTCQSCSQALADRARVKTALRSAVLQDEAPVGLRYRIQKEIWKSAAPVRWTQWALAVAASAVLLVGAVGVVRLANSRDARPQVEQASQHTRDVLKIGLNDHLDCAIDHDLASRRFTHEQMSQMMGAEFDGFESLVEQKARGEYQVVVGHRCESRGREFVHLILRNQDSIVSLAITRKNGEGFQTDDLAGELQAADGSLFGGRIQDFEVTGFETRDFLAFVVSNLPKEENVRIASNLAAGVRDFLSKLEG